LNRGFELAEATLRESADWEVVTLAQMGVLTFRCVPQGLPEEALNRLNRELVDATIQDGFAMLSSTALREATVLRMCTINPRSTEVDVRETIRRLDGWKAGWLEDWKAGY
jgi:glutamate/tyrosine decarboxylase-like PLP-dependent enzyme